MPAINIVCAIHYILLQGRLWDAMVPVEISNTHHTKQKSEARLHWEHGAIRVIVAQIGVRGSIKTIYIMYVVAWG